MMKQLFWKHIVFAVICASMLGALFAALPSSATAHAATAASSQPASSMAGRVRIFWTKNAGCGIKQVSIWDEEGYGSWHCFYLTQPGWGYMGLNDHPDPVNLYTPGVIHQVFLLDDIDGGPGWIRYYGGNYPQGTYCQFNNGQHVRFPTTNHNRSFNVEVTQIAINVPSSYHQCP